MGDTLTLAIAGVTGVVGRHITAAALARGWRVRGLTRDVRRHTGAESDIEWHGWDPAAAAKGDALAVRSVARALDGADVVINLAGATIADGRLDAPHRRRVLGSRVDATRALRAGFEAAKRKPGVWVNASAVGYYGDTGEERITEEDAPGKLFLSEVCAAWEAEAAEVTQVSGAPRFAIVRIGLVLAEDAPAWEKMLQPIRFGAGGPLGSGQQWWPWIDADDLAEIFCWIIENPDAEGVFNGTAPDPVRQVELAKGAAKRLDRPAFLPAPAFALRLALGGAADELLLPSCRALPERLEAAGFEFERNTIDEELDFLLDGV